MTYIQWSDKFSVQVKEIDEQHKKLIGMINKLHDALFDIEVQKVVINEMIEYAMIHFETEEKYMEQFQFSGYEEHKKEHGKFTEKAMDIRNAFEMTGCLLTLHILDFLKEWLENHLLNTDMKYVECFKENGLN